MKLQRLVLWLLVIAALLIAAAAVLLHVASRSEAMLRWGVEQLADRLPCDLAIDGLQGSLTETLRLERVVCENADYRVEARQVALAWSPWLLRHRYLDVSRLQVATLVVTSRPQEAAARSAPGDMHMPVTVRIAALEIGEVRIERGDDLLAMRELAMAYAGDEKAHRVAVHRLVTQWGNLQGEATLATQAPSTIDARVRIESDFFEAWPVTGDIAVSGDLRRLSVTADGSAGPLPLTALAEVEPFNTDPLKRLVAKADGVDLAAIDARLPRTVLTVEVDAVAQALTGLSGTLRARNTETGSIDRERLPLRALDAAFVASRDGLRLHDAAFDFAAAGSAAGEVAIEPGRIQLALEVRDLDLRGLYSTLRATQLAGSISMNGEAGRQRIVANLREGDLRFEGEAEIEGDRVRIERVLAQAAGAQVRASGRVELNDAFAWAAEGSLHNFDPARFGDFPAASINGTLKAQGELQPEWRIGMEYALANSRFRGQALGGRGKLTVSPARLRDADARLTLGGNTLHIKGAFGRTGDAFDFRIDAPRLAALDPRIAGSLKAGGKVSGQPARPAMDVVLEANDLAYENFRVGLWRAQAKLEQADDPKLQVRSRLERIAHGDFLLDALQADADGTLAAHAIRIAVAHEHLDLDGLLEGGWDDSRKTWTGALARLENRGAYAFNLTRPAPVELAADRVLIGATGLHFQQTDIALEEMRYADGELSTSGAIEGVRLSRLLALMDSPPPIETSLQLGARWAIRAGDTVDGTVELFRESGDVVVPGERPLALELSDATLEIRAVANRLTASAAVKGKGLDVQARAATLVERRGARWGVSGAAPLSVDATAVLESLQPLAAFAGPSIVADGRATLRVTGEGTVAEPRLQGTIEGEQLKVEQVENGIFLREGTLLASFGDDAITLTRFSIKGGEGSFSASGRLVSRAGAQRADLEWKAEQLTVVQHPDFGLTVTGAGQISADDARMALRGQLTADQGRVELRSGMAPSLGEDVHVAGRAERQPVSARVLRSDLDLKLDLGPNFTITGRGLNARLAGNIALVSGEDATLDARGEINVARGGTFEAYGQTLSIERGVFYFVGPVDNPGIEIRAMRTRQQVEAGVEVTGTARDPRVRLVSNPDVPDAEKLSWLVLGRRVESGDASEAQQLQSSAVALAAGLGTAPLQQQLARAVGVDEISIAPTTDGTEGGVVTVGKRLSDRIYVTNERNLATAINTLRISYQISRRWSVRTETGETDAVDLFFTIFFD